MITESNEAGLCFKEKYATKEEFDKQMLRLEAFLGHISYQLRVITDLFAKIRHHDSSPISNDDLDLLEEINNFRDKTFKEQNNDNKHLGSSFDDFLEEERLKEECKKGALKKVEQYKNIEDENGNYVHEGPGGSIIRINNPENVSTEIMHHIAETFGPKPDKNDKRLQESINEIEEKIDENN